MRVDKRTDYAVRVLVFLAAQDGATAPTRTIAATFGLSLDHLHKIARDLGGLGLIELRRGVGGGLRLARDAADVSVGAVVRALDDRDALIECFRPETDACAISAACALKSALRRAQEAFYAALDPLTLADVARSPKTRALLRDALPV
jgi:Rrf2 family nitric oxide-sensitive transcriptional repressor